MSNDSEIVQYAELRGFVPEPDGRGTFGILIPCLAVLFLNTWTVLHLNIPPAKDGLLRRFVHRFKMWLVCLIVPDAIATIAFKQWREARRSVPRMQKHLSWWTLRHGYYAEMGGFRVRNEFTNQIYAFRSVHLAWLLEHDVLTPPLISLEELDDRSDADWIAKTLACVQSAWFLLQAIARANQHLPLSTLETEVLPFIGATWWTYYFWWKKPVNIQTYTTVTVENLTPEILDALAKATCNPAESAVWWRPAVREIHRLSWDFYWFERPMDMHKLSVVDASGEVPVHLQQIVKATSAEAKVADWYRPSVNEMRPSEWSKVDDIVIFFVGAFINGLLLTAWNFQFPTEVELILWRACILAMLGVIIVWVPIAWMLSWMHVGSVWRHMPFYILTGIYGLCRTYALFEPFVGLRHLPSECFDTVNWTAYIPHLGVK